MFDKLVEFVKSYNGPVKAVLTAIIVLVALCFIGVCLIHAMQEFNKKNMKEGFMWIMRAVLIGLVAALGIAGVVTLVDGVRPSGSVLPFNTSLSGGGA